MRLAPDTTSPGLLVNPDWKPNTPGTFAIVIGVSRYDYLSTRAAATDTYGLGQLHVSALTAYRFLRWLEEQYRYDQNNGSPLARCWLLLSPTEEERALIASEEQNTARASALLDHIGRPTLGACDKAINAWFGAMNGLKSFPKSAQASRAFFFFSGHGLEISSEQQILLPCDYLDPQFNRNVNRALSAHNLFAGLAELAVPHQFFFLDACRNDVRELRELNPIGSPILNEPPAYRSNRDRIAPLFYASASGGQAWQAPSASKGLSLFGQALLDGLRLPGCTAGICPVNVFGLMPILQQRVNEQLAENHAAVRQPVRLSGSVADVEISYVQIKPTTLSAGDELETLPPVNLIEFRDVPLAAAGAVPKGLGADTIEIDTIFEDAPAREIWKSLRIYSFRNSAWLPEGGAYRIHRAARADRQAYQIVLSIPRGRGNHWLELSEPARIEQALRFACLLPAAEDGTTRYLIELDLSPSGDRIEHLVAGLAEDNFENLGRAARLWNQYQSLDLAAAAAAALDLQSTAALLQHSIQSGVAATIAGLILLRSRLKDDLAFQAWLDRLADWFADLPDGPVLLAEQLLRVTRAEQPPAEAIEQLLLLRARGLPVTADAFGYAARQSEDFMRLLPADAPGSLSLGFVHQRMLNALRFFRGGGLFSTFAGPLQGLTPALVEGDTTARRLGQSHAPTIVRRAIAAERQARLDAAPRGSIFGLGGLCEDYTIEPMPGQYFVAQEVGARGADLRAALTRALSAYGKPVAAGDSIKPGPILCKISGLIESTGFGVYELTEEQDRNVYLQLGLALGLGRPYVLIRWKKAPLPRLIESLDIYPASSMAVLESELGAKIQLIDYQPPQPESPGADATAVIAHGELDVLDFCLPIARTLRRYGLTPVILGDGVESGELQEGQLKQFLIQEGIPHQIVGSHDRTQLDQTVAAIKRARIGIYRIDANAAPDSFVALGIALSQNRPGLLIHHSSSEPPTNLRGMGRHTFQAFSKLEQSLPASFFERYRR